MPCRFCNTELKHTFCDLGSTPLANAFLQNEQLAFPEKVYPLHAYVCGKCLLVQLPTLHTPGEIFSEYAYFSSFSSSWLAHCQDYAQMAIARFKLTASSQVIELASNDGYLLQYFKERHIPVLGIEPAQNVAEVARAKGIPTEIQFFGKEMAKVMAQKADLLICNNVLAHVPDLHDFVAGMKLVLKSHGVITLEFPHLLQLMEHNQFDTLYHEHFSYFSFHVTCRIFAFHGLEVFDVERLITHGGSLRLYVKHAEDASKVITPNVVALLQLEIEKGLGELKNYLNFNKVAASIKEALLGFIEKAQLQNKQIVAYGAPAKGNTLLNYCGLNAKSILFTVDRNPYKQGKFLPGAQIPILSPETIFETKPDYVLILPWNLKEEIMSEMSQIRTWGAKFVIPIPSLEIYE